MITDEKYNMYIDDRDIVMVTDPCYDYGTWCTSEQKWLEPGNYRLFVNPELYGIERSAIVHEDYIDDLDRLECSLDGFIGVDSGMAGYFIGKPDFETDEEWDEFLKKYDVLGDDKYYKCDYGLFTDTLYGDGEYTLYSLWKGNKKVGLMINFSDYEDEEEEEDE